MLRDLLFLVPFLFLLSFILIISKRLSYTRRNHWGFSDYFLFQFCPALFEIFLSLEFATNCRDSSYQVSVICTCKVLKAHNSIWNTFFSFRPIFSNTERFIIEIALLILRSEWLLLNANSAMFQLYHGENWLIFNEMMMSSFLC